MLKVLMTGNPTYGLAEKFSIVHTQTDFASRTNNYDLCTKQGRVKLAQSSLNCDVFINSSALYQFNQSLVLETVWKTWQENSKKGLIINIGSTVDRSTKGAEWIYPQEKKALKSMSHQYAMLGIWGSSGIRVSYISFGSLETKKVHEKHPDRKLMNVVQAAEYIKWIIDSPINININELHMDPIQ
jgi:NAD(P)-dependent dehydrogenase (short-subunit alcohol dehydrogenase family)